MKKSPLTLVKEQFGDKAKLVEAVRGLATGDLWIDRADDDKGLDCVSNAKLLRLHALLSDVRSRFGSRDKLIDSVLAQLGRSKDAGYRARLSSMPLPRLVDLWRVGAKSEKAN